MSDLQFFGYKICWLATLLCRILFSAIYLAQSVEQESGVGRHQQHQHQVVAEPSSHHHSGANCLSFCFICWMLRVMKFLTMKVSSRFPKKFLFENKMTSNSSSFFSSPFISFVRAEEEFHFFQGYSACGIATA